MTTQLGLTGETSCYYSYVYGGSQWTGAHTLEPSAMPPTHYDQYACSRRTTKITNALTRVVYNTRGRFPYRIPPPFSASISISVSVSASILRKLERPPPVKRENTKVNVQHRKQNHQHQQHQNPTSEPTITIK